jgi:hypothetical protein
LFPARQRCKLAEPHGLDKAVQTPEGLGEQREAGLQGTPSRFRGSRDACSRERAASYPNDKHILLRRDNVKQLFQQNAIKRELYSLMLRS